ncbi:unnamed protein product [Brachionus calyciflorus]|uniref:Uncharacterized protein n=1 Tax=Brachionus calyciflorus TaxID=104777 RepID=A0A814LIA2_9BILA|nr:unnamed protein product [Brachionus calyciflorus]
MQRIQYFSSDEEFSDVAIKTKALDLESDGDTIETINTNNKRAKTQAYYKIHISKIHILTLSICTEWYHPIAQTPSSSASGPAGSTRSQDTLY